MGPRESRVRREGDGKIAREREREREAALERGGLAHLFNARAEGIKVVVKGLVRNVKAIVRNVLKGGHGSLEVGMHLGDRGGERAPLCAAELDAFQLGELHRRQGDLVKVMAALDEEVEPRKDGRVLELPLISGAMSAEASRASK